MSADQQHIAHHDEHGSMTKKKIWGVFWVLLGITAIEFFIALVLIPRGVFGQNIANVIYIALTLLKAFYIVAFFMIILHFHWVITYKIHV